MGRFDGRTAVVTGAGGGIGRACALLLAAEGAQVGLLDVADELAGGTADLAASAGGTARAYHADVTSATSVEDAVTAVERDLGPVTLGVGAAGIIRNSPFLELPESSWDTTMAVNLKGAFLFVQAVGRRAVSHGGGAVVAVASVAARSGRALSADYAASKAGVVSVVRSAALALAESKVTVNAVCPGVVDTAMTRAIHEERGAIAGISADESFARLAATIPLGRIETPEEVAAAVGFLLSPAASYITGQALNVCGGLEMD